MISYLEGIVRSILDKAVIIDVQGVGYRVTIGEKTMSIIPNIGSKVNMFTHFIMNQRDGSVELFGFTNQDELQCFDLLTSVSGIGPRSAQSILAAVDVPTLYSAIAAGDSDSLKNISGIGTKTAQRLVLELKSKVERLSFNVTMTEQLKMEAQATDALTSLGYSRFEAREALKATDQTIEDLEIKITQALRLLGKKQ